MTISEANETLARDPEYVEWLDDMQATHTRTTLHSNKDNTRYTLVYEPGYEGDDLHMVCSVQVTCIVCGNLSIEAYCIKRYEYGDCIKATLAYAINGIACKPTEFRFRDKPSRYTVASALMLVENELNRQEKVRA